MPSDERYTHYHSLLLLAAITFVSVLLVLGPALGVQAQPAAPDNVYWVTSSSNSAITTCAGAANDCSLRGAVQLANASAGADTIYISTTVTSISLSTPITLTGNSISIYGNGHDVTSLKPNGNFPALVINSDSNLITKLWINATGNHAGTNQHGVVINGSNNNLNHNSLSDLGGDGIFITNNSHSNVIDSNLIGVQTLGNAQWATCIFANDQWGIELLDANNNAIANNTSGCNGQDGLGIHGNSYNNTVTDNYFGVVNWGGRVPNGRAGVAIWSGTVNNIGMPGHGNVMGANVDGVLMAFATAHDNNIAYNSIGVSGTLNISNTFDGVNLQQGTTGNWISQNDIAYNANNGVGVVMNSPSNWIYYNTIHHQTHSGVWIGDSSDNNIDVNFIGVTRSNGQVVANCAAANGEWGVRLDNAWASAVDSNIIGCSGNDGVGLSGASTYGNEVYANWIGVTDAGGRVPNTLAGVALWGGAHDNAIGRSDFGNVIGANGTNGVYLGDATTANNWLQLNSIGISGTQNFSNTLDGVAIAGARNSQLYTNVIANNGHNGVWINSTTAFNNALRDNVILHNKMSGVALQGGAHDNQIGLPNKGNIIGSNSGYGVLIGDSATATNTVQMNSIGISGTTNMSNTLDGVAITGGAHVNRVYTNTIANNGHNGVWLNASGTINNVLQANTIRSNKMSGVAIQGGASGNSIGLGARSFGNLISANAFDGIYISDNTTIYNSVLGNTIGTNAAGNATDPNGGNGVKLDNGTYGNAIGWSATERNVIAGNGANGVLIQNGAHNNWVQFNDIGTNRDFPVAALSTDPNLPSGGAADYLKLPNGGGISVYNAYTNTIGGSGVNNFIDYNHHTGIYIAGGSYGNLIGPNIVRNSDDYGILLDGNNTAYNTITRTQVYSNGLDGIGERNNATLNVWTEVGIHDNGGLGIDKSASNDAQNIVNAPNNFGIDSINRSTGAVHGHADASVLGTVTVELYRVAPDPSGFGEGGVFLGKTTTDGSGNWTIFDTSPTAIRGCYTAFVTESFFVIPPVSSEFSANTCRVFLPLAKRQ